MPAVRLAQRRGRLRQTVGMIFNCPVVGERQRVEPLAYLGFQFDVVPVTSLANAIGVAREGQAIAKEHPCVGVALAAALEARAQACLGRSRETQSAIGRAHEALAGLNDQLVVPSAFGYDEAQLNFHEGNAFTHLHDTASAWRAQERALERYPKSDYMDRALTILDRSACLVNDGDLTEAMSHATRTVVGLTEQQLSGLISTRAWVVHDMLPKGIVECLRRARSVMRSWPRQ
jgi:hypothetical protein